MVNAKPIASIVAPVEQDDADEEIEGIDVDDMLDDIVLSEEESIHLAPHIRLGVSWICIMSFLCSNFLNASLIIRCPHILCI